MLPYGKVTHHDGRIFQMQNKGSWCQNLFDFYLIFLQILRLIMTQTCFGDTHPLKFFF